MDGLRFPATGTAAAALLQLTRPVNVAIAMLSVFVAALVTGTIEPLRAVLLACLSAGAITAAANTINDCFDIAIDRINQAGRPLAAGRVAPRLAMRAAIVEYLAGIALAAMIGPDLLLMALVFSALTAWYSARLKRTVLWGNLTVSLSTAAAFVFGAMAVDRTAEGWLPALFAFFFHFAREIIKDVQDIDGDRRHNAATLPVRYGVRAALRLTYFVFAMLVAVTVLPFAAGWYGPWYFAVVALGVYPVVGYCLVVMGRDPGPARLGRLSALLKADMLVGLVAIYVR